MVCRRQLEHRAGIGLSLASSDRHPRFKIRRQCFPIDAPLDDRSEAESEELNVRIGAKKVLAPEIAASAPDCETFLMLVFGAS
jgi:hypothetical protein